MTSLLHHYNCLQMDSKVTAHCAAKIVPVAMALFLKYSHGIT